MAHNRPFHENNPQPCAAAPGRSFGPGPKGNGPQHGENGHV